MDTNPTVAELLPSRVRAAVYAGLGVANAVYIAATPLYDVPRWSTLVVAGVNAAGFTLARANTST